ncbi:hypothetical protein pEaSNUABM40_00108 [Erwinia phage pEa_SNUABM_40]|uniref:Uncharacterized protein n=1 Tax=Erwinia phage pEa_SNUABM_3 TaxID=2869552 RepID=A0AAE8BYR3_9CAUD|nr:hypothetical protein MPK68_gp108 [Erwinia phage pEa_SNUABM_3]QZE56305.1 hypothetical protein pEaSNUABM3_00108 [Erwinia phage pEa_SNUABM_3]QZE56644.1 hypothetical protein pEaSNUABM20_00108 [Erwinia phage pEa_SNUABM_20]QZE58324.1 hypothetical protein pEaSNUABM40_00108 [Erwinia phage pEa_SNUABM_40]
MSRFRVRNAANNGWHDCVDTPMFIRTHEGDWTPLSPDKFSVRNQWGKRWHHIDDSFDPTYDDPCSNLDTGACGGGPTSTTKGSGNGIGSGGREKYDILKGYPAGFDLPDAGRTGFGLVNSFAPPTGRSINRPGIKAIESYDPTGVASRAGLGTYANPNVPYASVHGRGATITETYYAMPAIEGYVELMIASYAPAGASVDVYHMGVRVASTCGKLAGRSRIKFQFDPDAADMRIMVRVRTTQGYGWSLEVYPPRLAAPSDRGGLALDSQAAYDVINFPDVIHPDYIGSPIFPAPCHATVWPIAERIQNANAFEYYHFIGWTAGWMYLDYTSWETFDFIEVYQSGRRIATTLDARTGEGYLYFYFDPQNVACDIMVRVVSKDFGNAASLASCFYSLYCPGERGAREYMHPCQSYSVYSAGHPTTEDNFALGTQTDIRAELVVCTANSFDTKFEVFDQDMNVLDTSIVAAGRTGTLEFWKYPEHVLRSNITVRATAPIGCDWSYFVYCPIQPPHINVSDFTVPYRCVTIEGGNAQPPDSDELPWQPNAWEQTGGRGTGSPNASQVWTRDGNYMNIWGGVNGWFKWGNFFTRPIKQITFAWVYDGKNGGWHTIDIYERTAGEGAAQSPRNSSGVYQYFTFDVNIPAGQEIWLRVQGGGDRGDSNDLDYLSISNVVFA